MRRFLASLHKEVLLLARDWHAMVLLFAMPCLFVLIMSLALQERFDGDSGMQLAGWLTLDSESDAALALRRELHDYPLLELTEAGERAPLSTAERPFHLHLLAEFDDALAGRHGHRTGVEIEFAPELGARERFLIEAAVAEAFAYFNTTRIAEDLGFDRDYARQELLKEDFIRVRAGDSAPTPSAVQQSVSAWLIFAMFFIAIPVSTTFIQERKQQTLVRLRGLGLPLGTLYAAKLLPYMLINGLQLVFMLAIGVWLMPLFGAEALSLDVHLGALALIGAAVSFAAVGLAALIATLARSVEQATALSGGLNILLAAIGGIMIPTFVMPEVMQQVARISPMAWGLEGFLAVLVRGGGVAEVLPPAAVLLAAGMIFWALSLWFIGRGKLHE